MEHALLAYLLLLCATGGINSQPLSPDYGQMEDLFITTDRGDTTTTDSGSGDNPSVLLPRCMDVLRPADLIEKCDVPEAVSSRVVDTMDTALNQGICHSRCLEEQTIINDVQQFNGYPNWPMAYSSFFLSEDGRNGQNCLSRDSTNSCQLPRSCPSDFSPLMDCKRGCETMLSGVRSGCSMICGTKCQAECIDTPLPGGLGCRVERFPAPCRALCNEVQCSIGCNEGSEETVLSFESLQEVNDGTPPHPTLPPTVTHINNTLYRVDVETALPQVSTNLSRLASQLIGYCTVVIKVEGHNCIKSFYVLDDTNEVELGDFACRTVTISYAIATAITGVSNFSPPLTMALINQAFQFETNTNGSLLQILVPISVVLVILSMMIVLLILFCCWCRKHKKAGLMLKKNDATVTLQRKNNIHYGIAIPNNNFLIYSENLDLQGTIGQGQFGIVYKGHLYKDVVRRVRVPVAVKTIKGFMEPDLVKSLLEEFIKMSSFDHPNVLTVTAQERKGKTGLATRF